MSTGPGINLGKTSFVKEFLSKHRDANVDAVKEAWTAAENEGTVSESLVNKMRQKLGLTGGKQARSRSETGGEADRKSEGPAPARKPGRPAASGGHSSGKLVASKGHLASRPGDDEDTLDELEESLDELIQKIRDVGGRPDVVKALRRARRLLVRSHEG